MLSYLKKFYTRKRLIALDLLLLNICLILSFYLRFESGWLNYFDYIYLPAITLIGAAVFYFSQLYNRVWKYASIGELVSLLKSSGAINLLFMTFVFFWQVSLPRSIPLINFLVLIFALGGLRFGLRLVKDYYQQHQASPAPSTYVLVVGAGDAAEMIIREVHKHPELNKAIAGLVDDDPEKRNLEIHGIQVLGNRHDIPDLIEEFGVTEVIIAIPSAPGSEIKEIYELSNQPGVSVKTVPGVYEIINGNVSLNQLREVKVEDLLRRNPVDLKSDKISSFLRGKTVLVTGGGGSIGSELCRQIAEYNPERLIILDIYENSTYLLLRELEQEFPGLPIVPIIGSIRDQDKLKYVFARYKPEVVFHAAAHKHVPLMEENPGEAVKNNIFGTLNTVKAADQYGTERFVFISTDKAVNPTNVMGASKRVAEMIIQLYNNKSQTNFMAVRFGNVLGSCASVVPIFKEQIASGGPVTVTHPKVKRYFMTIPEAAQLVIQAGSLGGGGEVFLLDMGEPVKILDLARDLIQLSGLTPGEDIEIKFTGLRPGEKLYEELLNDQENNTATEHERIFISNIQECCQEDLFQEIKDLEIQLDKGRSGSIVKGLTDMVENYEPSRDNIREAVFDRSFLEEQQSASGESEGFKQIQE